MKRILIKLFFREKFVGQISAFIAALVASTVISLIPKTPEFVTTLLGMVMELPEGGTITAAGIVTFLVPLIAWGINAVVQQFIAADNNVVLQALKSEGRYDGPMDGWVGPKATKGIANAL